MVTIVAGMLVLEMLKMSRANPRLFPGAGTCRLNSQALPVRGNLFLGMQLGGVVSQCSSCTAAR